MKLLKTVALFEGSSLLALLFVAVPFKRFLDIPLLVTIIGPIHGILFLAFIGILLWHFLKQELSLVHTLLGIVASFLPFGTFVFKAKCLK